MKRVWNELMEWCGAVAVLAIGLPLLVVALIVLRFVLLAAAIVSVAGVIALYCANPRFRGWVQHI